MNTTNRVLPVLGAAAGIMFLAFGVALTASCRGSDKVAPEVATITLAANPATIILVEGTGSSDVVATVYSAAGVPQEDQDVRFSSSAGSLLALPADNQPAANIPIATDNLGNAHVVLNTTTTTTVTAKSGTATGTLSLSTVNGNLNAIVLNPDIGGSCLDSISSCSDTVCVTAKAQDIDGIGISGVVIVFSLLDGTNSEGKAFRVNFSPLPQATTDVNGEVHASVKLNSSDCAICTVATPCTGNLQAALQGGGFPSGPVPISAAVE